MPRNEIHVGLEIGTTKIAVVVGEVKSDGTIKILGTGIAPSRGVRKGEIIDLRQVQTCLQDALFRAEERSDVSIRSVILSVTGNHISSLNNRRGVDLPEDHNEITTHDIEEVQRASRDVAIPREHCVLHHVLQHFHVDDQERVVDPVGRLASRLEASYHIVHGIRNRVMNSVLGVRELTIEVASVVFAPLSSAQVVLNREARERGAIMVDIGGGTTDYAVYRDGAVVLSGCIPVGGDHITNDIATVLSLPQAKAEHIKITEGSAVPGDPNVTETIHLPDDRGFVGRTIQREELDSIINARVEEIFELLRQRIEASCGFQGIGTGIHITGGTSQLVGVGRVAAEVLRLPVQAARQAHHAGGTGAAHEDPTLSTAVGLVRYAQLRESEMQARQEGVLARLKRMLGGVKLFFLNLFS
ncbi:MAG: cell division protein FtsA [Verrucomicrobiales bacterium]